MLLRPKWIAGHVLVVTLAAVFVTLGFWQLDRHLDARDRERAAAAQRERPSLDAPDVTTVDDVRGRPRVSARGTYDEEHQVLVRDRVRAGEIGVGVLTPLRLEDGRAVLVDRGFVATPAADVPESALAVPSGVVRVAGIARAAQSVQGDERSQPEREPPTVDRVVPDDIAGALPYPVLPVWIALDAQDPPAGADAPQPAELAIEGDDGYEVDHLSYALQWWAFALIPLVGWPLLLWRVTRRARGRARDER